MPAGHKSSAYRRWLAAEGLDVISGAFVADLAAVPLRPWPRTGGHGCYINHDGSETSNDCYLCEIPPAGSLQPARHLHELMIFVLSGRGSTTVWQGTGGGRQAFEWQEGSVFAIPLNAHYQHFNTRGGEPARLLAVTNAPAVINMFDEAEFVFHCDYDFLDRFSGEAGYFDANGRQDGRFWESNFIPDVRRFELLDYRARGAGGKNVQLRLAHNTMGAHISEFPVGTYKKAHRHGPGAHVIVLTGSGYSLMWKEGEPPARYDWGPGALIIPEERAFHQHFNTGVTPARYLALRYTQYRDRDPATGLPMSAISTRHGGDQIDYEDEEPAIRQMYEDECARNGVECQMAAFFEEATR